MPIYAMTCDSIQQVRETSFSAEGIREREDLQRLLRNNIEIISPDTLIIAEEFCEWEDSKRRIDLLGLDKDANLVVIELKRTEDGGHMELQAIRYAVTIDGVTDSRLSKRQAILRVVKHLCSKGIKPEQIAERLSWYRRTLFQSVPGRVGPEEFIPRVTAHLQAEGKKFDASRYYCDQDDLIFTNGKTYAFCNQWDARTGEAIKSLLQAFPGMGITCEANDLI